MARRFVVACCAITVISVVVFFGYRIAKTHWRANAMWEKCVNDLRADGQPVTFADIEKLRPTIAPEYNGALMIENMSEDLKALDNVDQKGTLFFDSDFKGIDFFTEFHTIDFKSLRAFLSSHATILNKLEVLEGSRGGRTSLDYDTDLHGYMNNFIPDGQPTSLASILLQLQTLVAIRDGDLDRAIHSTLLVAQLANTLDSEPNLIHRLVQMTCDARFIFSLEMILRFSKLDVTTTKSLQQTIRNRLQQKSLKYSFQLERVYFLTICNGLISDDFVWSDIPIPDEPFQMSEIQFRKNQINGSKIYDELIRAADEPSSILTVVRDIEQKMNDMSSSPSQKFNDHRIVFELLPGSRVVEIHNKYIALLRCTQVALAVDQYYQQKKKFPDNLQQLIPGYLESIPSDPFDDKPLRSKKTDYGFVIYSIGENLVDDGGDVALTKKKKKGPDVGFRLSTDRSLSDAP